MYPKNQYIHGVLGEVINRSFTQAYSVTLEAQLFGEPNSEIITTTFKPAFTATLPEQPNPFCFLHSYSDAELPRISIRDVSVIEATAYAPVTVIPQRIRCADDDIYYGVIDGILRNDSAFPVYEIRISLWDELNYIDGFQAALLPPGAERSFTTNATRICWFGTPRRTIDSFRTAAQGHQGFSSWLPLIRS
jgi:hypothetical protein